MAIRENWKVNPVTGTKGWCLTMRCWESIMDDRLVDVNIVEIYTLSLVSTSLFAVENGETWETHRNTIRLVLVCRLVPGHRPHPGEVFVWEFWSWNWYCIAEGIFGKAGQYSWCSYWLLTVLLYFFSVWRVWRIQVNFNPVVSASTICARARDLLEVLVSFEMFRHASVVHNEYIGVM